MNRIHMIGNTHFDPVWLWTWDEGLASLRSTLRAALDRMDEDPDFIYSFACAPVFEQIERIDPELMARIRARVDEGRWSLDEGLWLQPDCNCAGLESYIRHCLQGQMYLLRTFGKLSDTVFNVDSFGHGAMLPQVYNKSRMYWQVISRPGQSDLDLGDPLFCWESPDGSRLLSYRVNMTGGIYPTDTEGTLRKALPQLEQYDHDLMMAYGVTNHGGAPTKRALADIHKLAGETGGRVVMSSTGDYFRRNKDAAMPTHRGEIPISSFGVFVNRPDIKGAVRRTERRLLAAERAEVLAARLTGGMDSTARLNEQWRGLLFNEFHDIIGGATISDACDDALRHMGGCRQQTEEVLHIALQRLSSRIDLSNADCPDSVWSLVIFNPGTADYSGWLEGEVQWAWEFDWYKGDICLTDEQGNDIPCQMMVPRTPMPGFRSRFLFRADVPALGWRTLRVRQRRCDTAQPLPAAAPDRLRDGRIEVRLDGEGNITAVTDLATGRVILRECARPVAVTDESDVWAFNYTGYGPEEPFRHEWTRITESGPLRSTIKTRAAYGGSFIEQTVSVYHDSGIVDGSFRVNWNERHKTLKLCFAGGERLTVATPGCAVERKMGDIERPMGDWLDMRGADGSGALLIGDCFFAYDSVAECARVRASVLRSPIVGDLRISPLDEEHNEYEYMSQGITTGSWRIVPHGAEDAAFAWRQAESFLSRPIMVDEANHPGTLPMSGCGLAVEGGEVIVTALKHAEDGTGDVVLRLQNMGGESVSAQAAVAGMEPARAELKPYEIATLRCGAEGWRAVDMLELDEGE